MPIKPIPAHFVQCDLCAEVLPQPCSKPAPHSLDPAFFIDTHQARIAAVEANWTCGPTLTRCPKCSPPDNRQ